jgi:hypothetical protein
MNSMYIYLAIAILLTKKCYKFWYYYIDIEMISMAKYRQREYSVIAPQWIYYLPTHFSK